MIDHKLEVLKLGQFANAFRVIQINGCWFLDFLVYSSRENKASVVSRIRVEPEYMLSMRDCLSDILVSLSEMPLSLTGSIN